MSSELASGEIPRQDNQQKISSSATSRSMLAPGSLSDSTPISPSPSLPGPSEHAASTVEDSVLYGSPVRKLGEVVADKSPSYFKYPMKTYSASLEIANTPGTGVASVPELTQNAQMVYCPDR